MRKGEGKKEGDGEEDGEGVFGNRAGGLKSR